MPSATTDSRAILAMEPLVEELHPAPEAEQVFRALACRRHCVFFDSALGDAVLGRYSFVAADPFEFIETPADGSDALARLAARMDSLRAATAPGLPPFQGGAAGLLGYELGRSLETLEPPSVDEFGVPAMAVGLYDVVIALDHQEQRAWIISQGLPEIEPAARRVRAAARLDEVRSWLAAPAAAAGRSSGRRASLPDVAPEAFAPQFDVPGRPGLTSNFSARDYLAAVRRAIDTIYAGDVFQVNLAQRLLFPAEDDSVSLYLRLRERNAAPLAGYFDLGDFQICSASPERFLSVKGDEVEARPIKGTRQRTARPEADLFAGDELRRSEKDRAENVMIVDLLRNDLSRVCQAESVHVAELCSLESYAYVQHLVSVVRGRLRSGATPIDLVRACFPGGSVTGAPKIRAMQIITELERVARGAYCGSLGYFGFDGSCDTSILIRTITAGRGWWQMPVGGGIVAQSSPEREYEETWHKAEGMIRALRP